MKPITFTLACLVVASTSFGQTILMKDGKKIVAKALRRSGDTIMATSPAVDNAPALQGEIGYPLAQIDRLEFPQPAVLKSAADLLAAGKAAETLALVESAYDYYAGFRDAPGSYWSDFAALKLGALAALKRDTDLEPLARQVASTATSPDTVKTARAFLAGVFARKGDYATAIEICDQVIKDGARQEALAAASMNKARSHQGLKQWDAALLAYLSIPVFYPEQKAYYPTYLLGAGQCYFELSDFPRAKDSLNEVIKSFPDRPEAEVAKAELDKVARREKALETVQ